MQLSLQPEYLPATENPLQDVVLLHGWGCSREIWRPLVALLRPWANITLFDIPGLAPGVPGPDSGVDGLLESILQVAPERALYLGWSLGGQLAIALAQRSSRRVAAVVTVCSNPCFVAAEGWPGMEAQLLEQFRASAGVDPGKALRRFDSLQVAGASQPRGLLRNLQNQRAADVGGGLTVGLDWLAQLDLREHCSSLLQPQLHLLGSEDALVPATLVEALPDLLAECPVAEVTVLEGSSHLAPLEAAAPIAARILAFIGEQGLRPGEHVCTEQSLAKKDVALSFSRAAQDYDSVAQLQRDVGAALLATLDAVPQTPGTVLDLGSGTGYFFPELQARYPGATYLGLDLAEGMTRFSRGAYPDAHHWLVGDAEALPLAASSVDLVFSSLAVQWCQRPELLFAELARVLRPGGRCVFTSLGPDTLRELRASWGAVDQHQHVNTFLHADVLRSAASSCPDVSFMLTSRSYCMQYRRVRELLSELKTLGAHNVNRDRPSGLTGRRALQGMMQAYEAWREDGLLPASYEVYFGILEKT
ncbi:malonyl-ACP O-methyltransferase BioC [Pseudohalioglobus lutimaris]|uniref:Malonyl-[acyl-carrier protein] O-methyltransferase n=1 Tax=Pseudohalioglobus lutimaris TaxID=1737061 RepID=A0A2N5X8J3_9GAMM|nr:malonyl-ACP O-methyltransferase BioC [Pseudohalioglobus lutimaris]PLW70788.1 malonyl-[acyl-carrier protein] O-methyltransferase BioC [Pseudohalioglobus lutimaris]